jgi:S1-C subfamily serine protease
MKNIEVTEGDSVFALGYPIGNVGKTRQYVILRGGVISRIHDLLEGFSSDYIIDAPVFPGNSGGPVIIKPEYIHIEGTQSHTQSRLIGLVKSYIPYSDVAISPQTGRPRVVFEENTGLTNVEPVDYIVETILQ